MAATCTSSHRVFVALLLLSMSSAPNYPQSAGIFRSPGFIAHKAQTRRTASGAWLAKCDEQRMEPMGARILNEDGESQAGPESILSDANGDEVGDAVCADVEVYAPPPAPIRAPCRQRQSSGGPPNGPGALPCGEFADPVPAQLTALGKEGLKIERAREAVLEILRSGNACEEWFEAKDAVPYATFQSLDFVIDRRGQQDIWKSERSDTSFFLREPYVAQAIQDGGAHTTITINAYGAFYRVRGNVKRTLVEEGPAEPNGTHELTVGATAATRCRRR